MTCALILGCSGPSLTPAERDFFRTVDPWGFILFRRNVETPEQVRALTAVLREVTGRVDTPILVDQEGGRVQRLGPPHWPKYPPAATLRRAANDIHEARMLSWLVGRLLAHDLLAVGITVDCVPVLDVPVAGANDVVGDRAYARDAATVASLGRAAAEGLLAGGVLPVVKHMPGHGRAGVDSHLALPRVDAALERLVGQDFLPFAVNADMPLAMTGHIVFEAVDARRPATLSRRVFREIIRGRLGYDGLVMSDDLSMKALEGDFAARTTAAYRAGCDVVLHCNGDMAEMEAVAGAARPLAGAARRRARAALARIARPPEPLEAGLAREKLARALAGVA